MTANNPAGCPEEVVPVFEHFVTCEFATLNKQGTPITQPLTPYIGEDRRTIDVSTGLSYPAKAERARRNPKVGMLLSNPMSAGLDKPPVVLVIGLATVRDRDLQANTDRYVQQALVRFPEAYKGQPAFMMSKQVWYFARVWMLVTPLRILWWPEGNLDQPPQEWTAPAGTQAPPSDPPPQGKQAPPWKKPPKNWRDNAEWAIRLFGPPVLTTVGPDGFPVPVRVKSAAVTPDGFMFETLKGTPVPSEGPACLTFHAHSEKLTGQENRAFVGEISFRPDGVVRFKVERQLTDFSLGYSTLDKMRNFLGSGFRLRSQLRREAARRGQPVPKVNLPTGKSIL